jgi:transcriptional regulator with XRE-family HTH domain
MKGIAIQRRKKGWTQQRLAEEMNVTPNPYMSG